MTLPTTHPREFRLEPEQPTQPSRWGGIRRHVTDSAGRILIYSIVSVFVSLGYAAESPMVQGIVAGAVMADYMSWLLKGLIRLPDHLTALSLDSVVNIASAVVIFKLGGVHVPDHPEAFAMAFLAYLATIGVKVFLYSAESITESLT